MLSDVMEYFSLTRDFRGVGYFETENHKQIFKELKVAIKQGQMVARIRNINALFDHIGMY